MHTITVTMVIDPFDDYGVVLSDQHTNRLACLKRVTRLAKAILNGKQNLPRQLSIHVREGDLSGYEESVHHKVPVSKREVNKRKHDTCFNKKRVV